MYINIYMYVHVYLYTYIHIYGYCIYAFIYIYVSVWSHTKCAAGEEDATNARRSKAGSIATKRVALVPPSLFHHPLSPLPPSSPSPDARF